jgi:hypothetical protein
MKKTSPLLKSDFWPARCALCGHSQYVHAGEKKDQACNAYTCRRNKKCAAFITAKV